jgi:hypothetical protein
MRRPAVEPVVSNVTSDRLRRETPSPGDPQAARANNNPDQRLHDFAC